jgi:hypothetical protein
VPVPRPSIANLAMGGAAAAVVVILSFASGGYFPADHGFWPSEARTIRPPSATNWLTDRLLERTGAAPRHVASGQNTRADGEPVSARRCG